MFCALLMVLLASCASSSVSRVKSDKVTDLNGYWNDTDVSIVCENFVKSCLKSKVFTNFEKTKNRSPLVTVGAFSNRSEEHIDTSIITSKMRSAFIQSGNAQFMASHDQMEELRSERVDQANWANEDKAKPLANEDAADFMLQGSVKCIVQRSGRKTMRHYYVYCELVDIETGRIVWEAEDDSIKKLFNSSSRW